MFETSRKGLLARGRWLQRLLALVALAWVNACGGSMPYAAQAESSGGQAPPPPAAPQAVADGYGYSYEESADLDHDAVPDQQDESYTNFLDDPTYAPGKPGAKGGDVASGKPDLPAPPMVVYTGYLKLQVRRILETVDQITQATEKRGGYVESLTRDSIVVRVPAKDFDRVMEEFALFGDVIDRRIQASDVSEQFTDLGARLAVAREARARLLALLEKTADASERLQIVAEVKRLTEQIDSAESTMKALQNLVDFYTISIDLQALVPDAQQASFRSPFPWVNGLSAHHATLEDGNDDFAWKVPAAFVVFDKADDFRAQAADTAMIRAARIDNEPHGDAAFWANAVAFEFDGRGEKKEQSGARGLVSYQVFVNDDLKPRYYLVGVSVNKDDLFVLEVFFPNLESYRRHSQTVIDSFDQFKPE